MLRTRTARLILVLSGAWIAIAIVGAFLLKPAQLFPVTEVGYVSKPSGSAMAYTVRARAEQPIMDAAIERCGGLPDYDAQEEWNTEYRLTCRTSDDMQQMVLWWSVLLLTPPLIGVLVVYARRFIAKGEAA